MLTETCTCETAIRRGGRSGGETFLTTVVLSFKVPIKEILSNILFFAL